MITDPLSDGHRTALGWRSDGPPENATCKCLYLLTPSDSKLTAVRWIVSYFSGSAPRISSMKPSALSDERRTTVGWPVRRSDDRRGFTDIFTSRSQRIGDTFTNCGQRIGDTYLNVGQRIERSVRPWSVRELKGSVGNPQPAVQRRRTSDGVAGLRDLLSRSVEVRRGRLRTPRFRDRKSDSRAGVEMAETAPGTVESDAWVNAPMALHVNAHGERQRHRESPCVEPS
jgi:hypothetical protein